MTTIVHKLMGHRILIVDDHPSFRASARVVLESEGFDVCLKITAYAEHPTVIMTSSRDGSDFGPLVTTSGACGFVPKAELSGERVQELLGS